jgi:hypothetical protein
MVPLGSYCESHFCFHRVHRREMDLGERSVGSHPLPGIRRCSMAIFSLPMIRYATAIPNLEEI